MMNFRMRVHSTNTHVSFDIFVGENREATHGLVARRLRMERGEFEEFVERLGADVYGHVENPGQVNWYFYE